MRTDLSEKSVTRYRRMLRWQIIVSYFFILLGVFVPVHVVMKYGLSSAEIYSRSGAVVGTANYFILGIAFGLFVIAIGAMGVLMAKRALRKMG